MCDGAWLTGAQEAEHHRRFDKVTQMIRGGMEVIMRAQGLGCDNQRWIEVVTADGKQRCAAADEHRDLFRDARGAGRGIGAVKSFETGRCAGKQQTQACALSRPFWCRKWASKALFGHEMEELFL